MYFPLDLKSALCGFVERETIQDYDRDAELALQRVSTGEVDTDQLTNAWARAYCDVGTVARNRRESL